MRSITILGSTGSIGRQTLDVCRDLNIKVNAITAHNNIDLLEKQAREFNVGAVSVYAEAFAKLLRSRLSDTDIAVYSGNEGNIECALNEHSDTVVCAMSGMIGLLPTIAAIKSSKRIAIANKETLVCAGHIIMPLARKYNAEIIPVDSEHSAIFQCLQGRANNKVKKILLTASGGPFYGKTADELENVTPDDAMHHPNWSMGSKITIDSATLMNKGLEMIEAKWLFGVDLSNIEVLIHRQSIVHSAVEFDDDAVIAQLGVPKMYIPIKYALTYPERIPSGDYNLSLLNRTLTFDEPDRKTFRCLDLAVKASAMGGLYPTVMNAANESAVSLFLKNKIKFTHIPDIIENALSAVRVCNDTDDIDSVIEVDAETRRFVCEKVKV